MARVSPLVRAQNAGEWSPLLEGRTDLQKYSASLRQALNAVITPQGPTSRRSGTALQAPVRTEANKAWLIPFIFNNDQAMQVEFGDLVMRFHSETGLLTYAPVAVTAAGNSGGNLAITAPGHGTVVGHQIVLAGFAFDRNLNGRVANVLAVGGDVLTLDVLWPGSSGSLATATMAHVYQVGCPYGQNQISGLRYISDQDTIYLFCDGFEVRKLQRFGATDWRLSVVDFQDGPYAPTNDTNTYLFPSVALGNVVPMMTAANLPSGVASASTENAGNEAWRAFDEDPGTYWEPTTDQAAVLQYQFAAGTIVTGYVIAIPDVNNDTSYSARDHAPGDWDMQGSDNGVDWFTLDSQRDYVVYDGGRSLFFPLKNPDDFVYYRLNIRKTTRNGTVRPRVARWAMTSATSTPVQFDAGVLDGINNGTGFQATDVGRLLRFKGSDGYWRWFKILTVATTARITARCMADPLPGQGGGGSAEWRLGLISATTGYPTCGTWFEDRLMMGGMFGYPDTVIGSVTGKYEVMSQTDVDGTVSDDNALVLKLNARKHSRITWLTANSKSLLVGTGSGEWTLTAAEANAALTARNVKARPASRRGCANVEPVQIDDQTVFVQRANRTVRELAYSFDVDAYRAPSLSLFSSHIGQPQIVQLEYAAEPHALIFARRGDGTVAVLTYNKEENVVGWQRFDVNGFVECISVIPASDGTQDSVWMIVRRTFAGQTRRFVERLTRFWDFDSKILDSRFVDCHAFYSGTEISTVYGLFNYEGVTLNGLMDGSPVSGTVSGGALVLPRAAGTIVLGIGYDSQVEVARLEAGSTIGTSQGKLKRIDTMRLRMWNSRGGQYAVREIDSGVSDWNDLPYMTPDTPMDAVPALFTGDTDKLDMPQTFTTDGSLLYRQPASAPLPMNVVALMPTLVAYDD